MKQVLVVAHLLLVFVLHCGVAPVRCGQIVTNGCSSVVTDTSQWLSVARGPGIGANINDTQQYWLSQRHVVATEIWPDGTTSTVYWTLPTQITAVHGLVLAFHQTFHGQDEVLRVLLQDAQNCFYDVLIPRLTPTAFAIQRTFCTTTSFGKLLPDSNVDMRDVRNLFFISFDKVVALDVDSLEEMAFAQIPEGNIRMASLVDASYQRNPAGNDTLFIVRGTNKTGQPSEIVNYQVNLIAQVQMTLTFGHFTYLDGESNTMFINDKSTHLFWTQVLVSREWGAKQGILFDYGLMPPHSFRYGAIPFGPQPDARWGAHAFSSLSWVNAMMITSTNSPRGLAGFTIQVVYLNASLPALQFVDELAVQDVVLPSFGQSLNAAESPEVFAVVMAAQTSDGQLCLQLFQHQ